VECGQDHATVLVESSTASDRQRRRPDVRRNSGNMTARPADDWQQNANVALMQSQRLGRCEQFTVYAVVYREYDEYRLDVLRYRSYMRTDRFASLYHALIILAILPSVHHHPHMH